ACLILFGATSHHAADWITSTASPRSFPLVAEGRAATLVTSPADATVVTLATADLARDLQRVTGRSPAITPTPLSAEAVGPLVLIGTLGHHPLIDQLVATRQLDLSALHGAWESFVITVVKDP